MEIETLRGKRGRTGIEKVVKIEQLYLTPRTGT